MLISRLTEVRAAFYIVSDANYASSFMLRTFSDFRFRCQEQDLAFIFPELFEPSHITFLDLALWYCRRHAAVKKP